MEFTFWELLITPFQPFTWAAWGIIILIVLYMSFAIKIIQSGKLFFEGKSIASSIADICYNTTTSFTSGSVDNASDVPSRSEKVIIAGFSVFGL